MSRRSRKRKAAESAASVRTATSVSRSPVVAEAAASPLVTESTSDSTAGRFGRRGKPLDSRHPFRTAFLATWGILIALLLAYSVVLVRQVVVLLIVAMFLAIGLNPLAAFLEKKGLSRSKAVLVIGSLFTLVVVGFAAAIIPPITTELPQAIEQVPQWSENLQEEVAVVERLNQEYQLLDKAQDALTSGSGLQVFGGVLGAGRAVVGGVVSTATVAILTLYFLVSYNGIKAGCYRLVPASRRERTALISDEILRRVGGYVLGTFTTASIAGTATFLFLTIAGVPYALALSLIVAVFGVVPMIGSTLGGLIVAAAAFFVSVPVGIAAVVFYLVYQQLENYVIVPRIMKKAVDVSPLTTILAALIGGSLLGILGALLAVPAAAALQLVGREVIIPSQDAS